MVDSHCHLADEAFAGDLDAVIDRAQAAGLSGALCVVDASDDGEVARAAEVVRRWPAIHTTAGIHPHRAAPWAGHPEAVVRLVRTGLAAGPRVRAIGEIGLDYHYDFAPPAAQREIFAAQVGLAADVGLPIVIHTREADEDTFAILAEAGGGRVRGVFHCFSGDAAMAARAVAIGFYVSFSGIVSFPKAEAIREAARVVPLDRVLAETDSPYLAPVPLRGKRNEPAWVTHVVEALAAARGATPSETSAAVTRNYAALFGK